MSSKIPHQSWSGSHRFSTELVERPQTAEEVQDLVRGHERVRVFGARHSFNDVADTEGLHLSLENLTRIIRTDLQQSTVTVEGGIRYGALGADLHRIGYGLHNTASLPHISVAGAVSTATHGSGDGNPNLATTVRSVEVVKPDGDRVWLSPETMGDSFQGVPVSLGTLGPILALELAVEPTFRVRQNLYRGISFSTFLTHLDEIMGAAYSVSIFTNWVDEGQNQIWLKRREEEAYAEDEPFYGALPADSPLHPLASLPAEGCTEQMGKIGPWHLRLPHFLMSGLPDQGAELQSEYFVPRQNGRDALLAVQSLGSELAPLVRVSEVRTVAADSLWLSPSQGEPLLAIHFTWRPDRAGVLQLLRRLEAQLMPFGARPHWGKLFNFSPGYLADQFPRLIDFSELLLQFDPQGKFRNPFVERILGVQG